MNQVNQIAIITVTSVVGNPVLTFAGVPSKKIIAKAVARQFGYQMQGGIPVAHCFCGVVDPAPEEELRPEGIDLWCKEDHEGSRRWASKLS
jgi:hypothetical protein